MQRDLSSPMGLLHTTRILPIAEARCVGTGSRLGTSPPAHAGTVVILLVVTLLVVTLLVVTFLVVTLLAVTLLPWTGSSFLK